jgi:hypothetical protein
MVRLSFVFTGLQKNYADIGVKRSILNKMLRKVEDFSKILNKNIFKVAMII